MSQDHHTICTGSWDGTLRLTDIRAESSTNTNVMVLKSHTNTVSTIMFSPMYTHHIVSGSYDGTVKVWDIRSKVPLLTLRQHGPDERILSVYWDETSIGAHINREGGYQKEHNLYGCIISGGTDKKLRYHTWM